ncbi:MAG: hypothetical protein JNM13_03505 [Hyphomicrobiaceae bacterium]|nr:hypothetical protein [Hyphomicrobiaceae bacterium]
MQLEDAVDRAKNLIQLMFRGEEISHLGVEEAELDRESGKWRITVGFARPWNTARDALSVISGVPTVSRAQKVVTIDNATGDLVSIKNHDIN